MHYAISEPDIEASRAPQRLPPKDVARGIASSKKHVQAKRMHWIFVRNDADEAIEVFAGCAKRLNLWHAQLTFSSEKSWHVYECPSGDQTAVRAIARSSAIASILFGQEANVER